MSELDKIYEKGSEEEELCMPLELNIFLDQDIQEYKKLLLDQYLEPEDNVWEGLRESMQNISFKTRRRYFRESTCLF